MDKWLRVCLFAAVIGVAFGLGYADEDGEVIKPPLPDLWGGAVQGVVTTASGRPLEGAVVSAMPTDANSPGALPPEPASGMGAEDVAGRASGASVWAGDRDRRGMHSGNAGRSGMGRMEPGGAVESDGAVVPGRPDGAPARLLQVRTDREGRFRMKLPFGRYILQVAAPGFWTVFYTDAGGPPEATVVVVDAQTPVVNVEVVLNPVSTLSGRVTDEETGAPVASGVVAAERLNFREGFRRQGAISPEGDYLIEGLKPGVYRVRVLAQGYLTAFYTGGERNGLVEVAEGDRASGIDVAVLQGLALSGKVTDIEGVPLKGATLVASPLVGEGRRQTAKTDANGAYRLSGLAPGSYLVTCGKPGYGRVFYGNVNARDNATPVRVMSDEQPADIDFQLKPVGSIFGRITARTGGEPVAEAVVRAKSKAGGLRRQVRTDVDGRYLISDLPTADYIVRVWAEGYVPQFYPDALEAGAAQPVRVLSDAHTTGIDLSLGRLSSVSGKVTDREGNAVAGAKVSLMQKPLDAPLSVVGQGDGQRSDPVFPGPVPPRVVRSAETEEDGTYRIERVPPGTYIVQAVARGFALGVYSGEEPGQPAEIAVGVEQEIGGKDVVLPRLGVITGQITAADDGAPEEVEVVAKLLSPAVAGPVVGRDEGTGPPAGDLTAASSMPPSSSGVAGDHIFHPKAFPGEVVDPEKGVYRIIGLPEGTYVVRAKARGYVTVWYDGADRVSDAARLQVRVDQEMSGIDFALTRGGTISGYVLADGTGEPVPRAVVAVQRLEAPGIWRVKTGRNGAYEISGLPGGSYLLSVQARGFIGEFYNDTTKPDRATPIEVRVQAPVADLILGLSRRSPADFDGDGDVDFADLILFLQRMMARSSRQADTIFDLDRNGRIDFEDFLAMVRLMRGAGKVAAKSGALAWRNLEGRPDEVLAGLEAESIPASQGYVVRVIYDPQEAAFLGTKRAEDGLFENGTFLAFEDEDGVVVIADGRETDEGIAGNGALAQLRFRPLGGATGVTLRMEAGMALTPEGAFVPLRLPEPQRLEIPPRAFRLLQNVPNPFNPATAIAFELPEEVHVELDVYNLVGQRVRTLVSERRPAGRYRVSWDGRDDLGRDVSSGVYFYRLTAGAFKATRRMMLLR